MRPSLVIAGVALWWLTTPATAQVEQFDQDLRLPVTADADVTVEKPRKEYLWPYSVEHGPKKYLEWIIKDPVNLVTRPFFWGGEQWQTFGIELGITGVLFPLDDPVRDFVQDNRSKTLEDILDPIRNAYTGDTLELYGAGMFAAGLLLKNEKLADSGFLATESVFYSIHLSGILKTITKRERPNAADDQYEFNGPGGSTRGNSSSFVSGEVIAAFAFASSVSEVWQNPWLTWPLYTLAVAVGAHRLEHDAHWLTDVVGAAFLGHAVGKTIVRFHYRRDAEGVIAPYVTEDAVGVQVAFLF